MGNLNGHGRHHKWKEEKQSTDVINNELEQARLEEGKVQKLLLLGAGESGKSTLFKQMINIYGKGYSDEDRKNLKRTVYNSATTAMKELIKGRKKLCEAEKNPDEKKFYELQESNLEAQRSLLDSKLNDPVDLKMAQWITDLWGDSAIQKAYQNSNKFQLIDTCEWFMAHIDRIAEPGFIPSMEDILRTRVRTTGIIETDFTMQKKLYKMVDVGGQRNERKKWIHCFEDVTAVIFVAAISGYNQTIFEDDSTNRLREGLALFEEYCNNNWFEKTSIILFLNKKDLFKQKIKVYSLKDCFPDFDVDPSLAPDVYYKNACDYMIKKFQSLNRNDKKTIYTHVTCATDKNNIKHVFDAVRHIVVTKALDDGGFL